MDESAIRELLAESVDICEDPLIDPQEPITLDTEKLNHQATKDSLEQSSMQVT